MTVNLPGVLSLPGEDTGRRGDMIADAGRLRTRWNIRSNRPLPRRTSPTTYEAHRLWILSEEGSESPRSSK